MVVKFGDTKEKILNAINTALGNSSSGSTTNSGYKEIFDQNVRVWDLEPGIYKWTYFGEKFLYYNGATGEQYKVVGTIKNVDVFIEITRSTYTVESGGTSLPGETIKPGAEEIFKLFKIEVGRGQSPLRYLYWGYTSESKGDLYIRDFQNIPTSEPKILPLENGNDSCSLQQSFEENGETKGSTANGKYSAAFNQNNTTYQRNSFVTGGGNEVGKTLDEFNVENPTGIDKWGSTYSESNSFANAGGQENVVKGRGSHVGGGLKNEVYGNYSGIVAGDTNAVLGDYSGIVAGSNNVVTNNNSAVLAGKNNEITSENSAASGLGLKVNKPNTTVVGQYNNENSAAIFAVGTGAVKDGTEYRNNALEVFPNGIVKASRGSIFEGNVDFTNANVVGIAGGSTGGGNGIPTLVTQTVNLADLEAGIYKWEFSVYNEEYDENDTTKMLAVGHSTCTFNSNPVFLHVHKAGDEVSFEAIDNEGYGYDETHRVIYYGGMNIEFGDGYYNSRALNNIPEEYIDTTQFVGMVRKTKITVAGLKSYLANYSLHFGKMVQLVYRGTDTLIRYALNSFGLLTIHNGNSILSRTSFVDASRSEISGTKYLLNISSTDAYVQYYNWTFDFAQTGVGNTTTVQITDTAFDIYIIE